MYAFLPMCATGKILVQGDEYTYTHRRKVYVSACAHLGHVSSISFFEALGLLWLMQLLTSRYSSSDKRIASLGSLIELCVPSGKEKELAELKEGNPILAALEVFSTVKEKWQESP